MRVWGFAMALAVFLAVASGSWNAAAGVTKLVKKADGSYGITHDGVPYFVQGAGVDGTPFAVEALKVSGGNSVRTWGAATDPQAYDMAQGLGVTVCAGLWLLRPGEMNYADPSQVKTQHDRLLAHVNTYKNHPAILVWGIGNEYEGSADVNVWQAVQQLAADIKLVDPNHPTATVWAMITKPKMDAVKAYCPALDIIGINVYGSMPNLAPLIVQAGLDRPYLVTEYGPPGPWGEAPRVPWGASLEMTSTEKADFYLNGWNASVVNPGNATVKKYCLGAYVYFWGIEPTFVTTHTWYSTFLPGRLEPLGAIDAMAKAWTKAYPSDRAPLVKSLTSTAAKAYVAPEGEYTAQMEAVDPEGDQLRYSFEVRPEMKGSEGPIGAVGAEPPVIKGAIVKTTGNKVIFKAPATPGAYRLFAYARDSFSVATANFPFYSKAGTPLPPGQEKPQ